MKDRPRRTELFLFVLLFSWISFFPAPVHERFGLTLVSIFAILVLLVHIFGKKRQALFEMRDGLLWIFLLALSLNIFTSVDRSLVLNAYFDMALAFIVAFYIGKSAYSDSRSRLFVCGVISICVLLVSIIGLAEFFYGKNILYEYLIANSYFKRYSVYFPRPMSTLFNPAILGSFVMASMAFSLVFCEEKKYSLKMFGIFSVLLSTCVIVLAASRGAFLGLIVFFLAYLWLTGRKRSSLIFIAAVALFMAISSFSPNKALKQFGYSKVIHGSFDSAISGYRKDRVSMAINMTKDHPFVGVGLKHFRLLFNKYSKYKDGSIEPYELMIPDNMYLSFLSESGILGLLAFLALVFSLLRRGIRRYDQEANDRIRLTILIPWCALVGLSVSMGSYDLFYWPNPATLFALTCGFIQSS